MVTRKAAVVLITAIFTLTLCASEKNEPKIECRFESVPSSNLRALNLTFATPPPASDKTEELLRTFLQGASSLYPDKDIVAKAWFSPTGKEVDEKSIPLKDGSTALYYRSASRSIVTSNQSSGVQSSISVNASKKYSVKYEERTNPKPIGKNAKLEVVFASTMKEEAIYPILVDELRKAMSSQSPKLETTAYAFTGDLSNPSAMKQVMGSDGVYVRVECNPSDGKIVSRNMKTGRTRSFGTLKE